LRGVLSDPIVMVGDGTSRAAVEAAVRASSIRGLTDIRNVDDWPGYAFSIGMFFPNDVDKVVAELSAILAVKVIELEEAAAQLELVA